MSTGTSCHFGHLLQVKKKSLCNHFIHFFFKNEYMYIAPGQGQAALRGQNSDVNRKALSLYPFVASFEEISLKSDFIHFLMILYMCIAPRQGLTTPWWRNLYVNRNILSLRSFVGSFKKNLFVVWFYTFFYDFIHVYSPKAGRTAPRGQSIWCQQKCLVTSFIIHLLQVSKKCLWSLLYMFFFSWFNTCI